MILADLLALALTLGVAVPGNQVHGIKIGISHWNDIYGQLQSYKEETAASPIPCASNGTIQCIGGLAYISNLIHDDELFTHAGVNVTNGSNVLRLSSGNMIGGASGWVNSLSGNAWSTFSKYIYDHFNPDVSALGIKEFEAELKSTIDYMNLTLANLPWTLANTCEKKSYFTDEETPESIFCENVENAKLLNITIDETNTTYQIAVIGFINPIVEQVSLSGKLKFSPVVESINKQVNELSSSGIKTFIALGDGNLQMAKEILDGVSKVQLVIYGKGFGSVDRDYPVDEYPMKYKDGYIVTAGRYGSTVGKLVLELNTITGGLSNVTGHLVPPKVVGELNNAGKEALMDYHKIEADINKAKLATVGRSHAKLVGGKLCWTQECTLGNLVADAMVNCALRKANMPYKFPLHAIWHGGALFNDQFLAGARISKFDIHTWLPYHNTAHLVRVNGSCLRRVFEASATGIDPVKANAKDWGQFLQVSNGIEVMYDVRSGAPLLKSLRIAHDHQGLPYMGDVEDGRNYYLVIPTFLYEGKGVYNFTSGFWQEVGNGIPVINLGYDDVCVVEYISALGAISVGLEERIWVYHDGISSDGHSCVDCKTQKGLHTAVTVVVTIVGYFLLLGGIYVCYFYIFPRWRKRIDYPRDLSL